MTTQFKVLLNALSTAQVDYIIIGGIAMIAHGSSRVTKDLDIFYSRAPENLPRLVSALQPFKPTLRGAPPELPFLWDVQTVKSGLNFTLTTAVGDIDVLGEVTGIGFYEQAIKKSDEVTLFGNVVRIFDLETLTASKRATGRLKDLVDLAEIAEIEKQRKAKL